ncbi:MAG: PTS sugar transporter subunit IIA [candidate division Zixibacteria bacterium]|nr:PTS sugar transporter subunit IIA [candidate division Zixibacteria bacterium]
MRLSTLLSEELVLADMSADNKDEAIVTLLAVIGRRFPLLDMETIAAAIDERERIENTSYGHGYAFPHARTDAVERMYIAFGVSKKGLSDKTPDDVTLRVVCLMLTPSNISQLYLQTLSAFARFARDPQNLKKLLDARGVAAVIEVVHQSGVNVDRELLVRDIMVEKVISVTTGQSLKEVANLFYKHRIGEMPVVDDQDWVVGQISNRDLIKAALSDLRSLLGKPSAPADLSMLDDLLKTQETMTVDKIMWKDIVTTTEDTPVVRLATAMLNANLRMVPVVRDGKLVGVVVMSDIVSKIIRG